MHRVAKTHQQISEKASRFTESVIREMTRLAMLHGAVNLAQGFPDFSAPEVIKRAAQDAIAATSTSTRSPGAPRHCATASLAICSRRRA